MELKWRTSEPLSKALTVQIVPLWNWNRFQRVTESTVVSFKLYLYGIEINIIVSSKGINTRFKLYLYGIEISISILCISKVQSSNCTFMELKCIFFALLPYCCRSSNCTFMELKCTSYGGNLLHNACSNCTFMELKWWLVFLTFNIKLVQIVPLWNWNKVFGLLLHTNIRFKLYLYGIEILAVVLLSMVP